MGALNQRTQPDKFDTPYYMGYQLADGRYQIVLSGVAIIDGLHGKKNEWVREPYELMLRADQAIGLLHLPPPPEGRYNVLQLEQWAVYASLNEVFNAEHSVNAGYGVERFYMLQDGDVISDINIGVDLAVCDIDGRILRVGYHVIVIGSLGTRQQID